MRIPFLPLFATRGGNLGAFLMKMISSSDPLTDPRTWISALAFIVSIFAVFISWRSMRNSTRALQISEAQEMRRQPQLSIYLANGYRRLAADCQLFGLLVSVGNRSDINNSIARAELQITYILKDSVEAVCRIQHNPALAESQQTDGGGANIFTVPVRVDAHQTVSGWFLFALDDSVIRGGTVDSHSLILEDTHGVSTAMEPMVVRREWIDEIKTD